jgi:Family of unknown function (DUF6130)
MLDRNGDNAVVAFHPSACVQSPWVSVRSVFPAPNATSAFAQSAMEVRGASPYVAIENEPAPKLIVDSPLREGLAQGVFWAQFRD